MHRPPRPISKQSKLQPSLHYTSTDPPKLIKSIQPFQIVVSKFNTVQQCIGKSGFKYIDKKVIQPENNYNQISYPTVMISPNIATEFIHNMQNQQLHKINKPVYNSFKIRHLSSQGKRCKQIVQYNQNNVNNKQNLNCNTKAYSTQLNQNTKYTVQKTSRLQTDTFIQNKNQQNFRNIVAKTGTWKCKIKQNIQNLQKISFIIPQSLFQQSIVSASTISLLKNLVNQITKIQCSSILQLSSNKSVKALQQIVQKQKINISYIIWNSQKYVQSLNILNLTKIQIIQNFVVIVDNNSNLKDVFIGSMVQRQKKRKFIYWGIGEIGEILEIVRNLRVNIDDQCNVCSISYRISQPINITQKLISNPQLLHKSTLHPIPSSPAQTQPQSKLSQHMKTFDEQYRNKMVQLVKILHQQHKSQQPLISSKYNNNNQYMKLYINQQIMEIMDCYVSNTTAYQFVSEIVRNNMGNYRQIFEYRNRSKYMDKYS